MRAIACIFLAAGLYAQSPQFEVATMKLLPPGQPRLQRTADAAQLHYPSVSLLSLLREAYRLNRPEQIDGPAWMRTQFYSIEAKLPPNTSKDQIPQMLQALLADRLKLAVHHESRPVETNLLQVARKGAKMRAVTEPDADLDLKLEVPMVHLSGHGSIGKLVEQLNHGLGGADPWIDRTGLSGVFEIKLDYAMDMKSDSSLAQRDDVLTAPKLPQALEGQLGLRVEVKKAPADFVVVDRVEKIPTDN
jgi:uncharacterized protein (TIGR03435 family)